MQLKRLLMLAAFPATVSCCGDDDDEYGNFVSKRDRTFVSKTAMSNRAETDAGTLAATKATDTAVQSFGRMMVAHHAEARKQLQQMAAELGAAAPDTTDAAQAALLLQLQTLTGRAFDSAYIVNQVNAHKAAIALYEEEAAQGNNSRIRGWAKEMLPRLEMQLYKADLLANGYR